MIEPPETHVDGQRTPVRCAALPSYLRLKAFVDRYLALLALTLLLPVMAVFAVFIRRGSPGPALFRQTRAGRDGRPFTLFKFRTMLIDAETFGDSPQSAADPRITRFGRWLREWSLDELPQLLNVLRGEMSLVGPRPLYVQQMAEWDARQRGRLLVKPGLTGLAQINGRAGLTIEDKLEHDVQYVENISAALDVEILWRTLRAVVRAEQIYEVRYSKTQARRSAGPHD